MLVFCPGGREGGRGGGRGDQQYRLLLAFVCTEFLFL